MVYLERGNERSRGRRNESENEERDKSSRDLGEIYKEYSLLVQKRVDFVGEERVLPSMVQKSIEFTHNLRERQRKCRAIKRDREGRSDEKLLQNLIMRHGKVGIAEKKVHRVFEIIKETSKVSPKLIYWRAVNNLARPVSSVRRTISGQVRQVPVLKGFKRGRDEGIHHLYKMSIRRSEQRVEERLALEIMEAAEKRGLSYQDRERFLKQLFSNRHFVRML